MGGQVPCALEDAAILIPFGPVLTWTISKLDTGYKISACFYGCWFSLNSPLQAQLSCLLEEKCQQRLNQSGMPEFLAAALPETVAEGLI